MSNKQDQPICPDLFAADAGWPIQDAHFRRVLSTFASGVVVVTAMSVEGPVGMTCQSFFSVSLQPALVAFSPARSSTTYPRIRTLEHFAVNILSERQRELSNQFARSGTDKWAGVEWSLGPHGCPILHDSVAAIECRHFAEHEAGDHLIVIGEVQAMNALNDVPPLLFHRGAYAALEDPVSA
ncbi:flavin reductase family protein [Rhodococcus rhodochrous]|uniref:flavin reductase family protein n=1 Tax=Rhodococcus rhodochrous TaxID=1829 RepID=UPI0002EB6FFC|nr:flavin reductase family protein [Rhodococcus rhodochrous]